MTTLPRDTGLYLFAILTSVLLSFWINYHEAVINPDAICYLLSAKELGQSGVKQAMHLCGQAQWPFYSLLIYALVHWSQVSYSTAAYLLDGFFSLISVLTFTWIVQTLGGTRRVCWLAALTILLAHEFNNVREYIIRDHGFWAFYLISLLCLLHYFIKPKIIKALLFSTSLILATLFRIEGAIFLFTLPFLAWFGIKGSWRQKASHFLILNLPLLILSSLILLWLAMHPQQTLSQLGRVQELLNQLQHGLVAMAERFQSSKNALAASVLTSDSVHQAGLLLGIMLLVWYVIMVAANVSWIYALLILYAWRYRFAKWTSQAQAVVLAYLFINVMITFGFLAQRLFLSKRYLIALSLILMLWVPFALEALITRFAHNKRQRWFLSFAVFFMVISAVGGIFDFGYSKMYLRSAGAWLAEHVPANATLYANDDQLLYYSQHEGNRLFETMRSYPSLEMIAKDKWKHYDYLALRIDKKQAATMATLLQSISLTPLRRFNNKRGDQVVIYKTSGNR